MLKHGEYFMVTSTMKGLKLNEITDWNFVLAPPFRKSLAGQSRPKDQSQLARSMNELFGTGSYEAGDYLRPLLVG